MLVHFCVQPSLFTACTSRITDPDMPGYGEPPSSLWRRYSEFELLRNYLEVMYPYLVIPPLPEKRVSQILNFI